MLEKNGWVQQLCHSVMDVDFFIIFSLCHDCIACASSPPQRQLHKLLVVCACC